MQERVDQELKKRKAVIHNDGVKWADDKDAKLEEYKPGRAVGEDARPGPEAGRDEEAGEYQHRQRQAPDYRQGVVGMRVLSVGVT